MEGLEAFNMDDWSHMSPAKKKQFQAIVTKNVRDEEQKKAARLAKEHESREQALKRKAAEALENVRMKEDVISRLSYLIPPKSAKNDYMEQKPAKYVFKCMDGDIQIPDYGIFRTDFYYKERI